MPRRYAYEDSYDRGRRDYGDPVLEEDEVEYHRRAAPPVLERDRPRGRGASPPEFLREDYGRSATAGPMVVSSRNREPEYRHQERSRKPVRDEHEEIMYHRGPERERVPPREFERERRDPYHDRGYEEDVTTRRREHDEDDYIPRRQLPREREHDRDEVLIRRGGGDRNREYERERDDHRYRPISHERQKPRSRSGDREEIIIRRDEREKSRGRHDTTTDRDEVIIRRHEERDRSSSSESARPPPEPPTVRAPPIHQDVVTHHRHIDHGYQVVQPPRAPSPESPPRDNYDEIDIRRRGERDGRSYDDQIVIDHREKDDAPRRPTPVRRPSPPQRDRGDEDEVIISRHSSRPQPREHELVVRDRNHNHSHDPRDERDIREEADYYNRRATERSRIGEAYNGATRDWEIVDVPPGTKRVTMDGVGGGTQDISWQRYNGVRRSKFIADGEEYPSDFDSRENDQGRVGRRYRGVKDKRDHLWTEITKDLIIKEAIEKMGYDYEETDYFYYVIAYLRYDDIAALVALSEELRQARRDRMREIEREQAMMSRPAALPPPPAHQPLMIERPSRPRDEERFYERDLVIDRERRGTPRPMGRGPRW